jgi:cutinase
MRAAAQCPDAKIVLGGFSQGAQVLRKAVSRIPATIYHRILAVVSFSDSKEGQPFPGGLEDKHVSFCVQGDWVCDRRYSVFNGAHKSLFYYDHLEAAAEFIRERLRDG